MYFISVAQKLAVRCEDEMFIVSIICHTVGGEWWHSCDRLELYSTGPLTRCSLLQLNWVWIQIHTEFLSSAWVSKHCITVQSTAHSTVQNVSTMIKDHLFLINKNWWLPYTHNLISVLLPAFSQHDGILPPHWIKPSSCRVFNSFLQGLLLDKQIPAPSLFYGEVVQYSLSLSSLQYTPASPCACILPIVLLILNETLNSSIRS